MMFMNNLHKIYIYYRVLFGSELRDNFGMEARFKSDLLCVRWLLTRCPAARAERSESSPAKTVAHTILASCVAFSPGFSWWGPCTPSICKQERK